MPFGTQYQDPEVWKVRDLNKARERARIIESRRVSFLNSPFSQTLHRHVIFAARKYSFKV